MIIKFKVGEYYDICEKYEHLFEQDDRGVMRVDNYMYDATRRRFVIPELHLSFRESYCCEKVTEQQLMNGDFESECGFLFYPENEKNPYKFDFFTGCSLSYALTEFMPNVKSEIIDNLEVWCDTNEMFNGDCFEEGLREYKKERRVAASEKRRKTLEIKKSERLAKERLDALNPFNLCWLENHKDATMLCARCKSKKQLNWILKNKFYYFLRGHLILSNISNKQIEDKSLKLLILYFSNKGTTREYYLFEILDTAPKYINTLELNSLGYPVPPKYNGYEAVGFNLGNSLSLCYPRISQAIIKKRDELATNIDNWDEFCPLIVNAKDFM